MTAEQLLDTVGHALQRSVGFCDLHTDEPIGSNALFPDRMRLSQPADFYGFGFDYYFTVGSLLGGCSGGRPPAAEPALPALFAMVDVATRLCAPPSTLFPAGFNLNDGSNANASTLATFLFQNLIGRAPAAEELAAVTQTAAACLPDRSCGMQMYAEQLCGAILRSSAFIFY